MEFRGFKSLETIPAIYSEDLDLVVIADIHLGLEGSMTSKGNYVPKFQLDSVKEEIEEIYEETNAERILVNGDLKNEYSTSYTEKKELSEFLDILKDNFNDVILVKGNHDTIIEKTAQKRGLDLKDYHLEKEVLFVHGDKKDGYLEKDFQTIVIGHEHPALAFKDDIGVKEKVPCVLYGETGGVNLIVLPAYSKISNGTEVNNIPSDQLLSPILRELGVADLKATAISREAGSFEFPSISKIN